MTDTRRTLRISYAECTARERIDRLVDAGSFHEWLAPSERLASPHLRELGVPAAFDDGVAIGRARLDGHEIFIAAQEGGFMGGGVGEIHGAKLAGWMRRALREQPEALVLLAESGGVRLHEANAGLIAVSEIMRALFDVRAQGIPVIVLIGGANGCFGGMGIVARCADHVIMSDSGRLAMSGPEVIEATHGVDEFDSRDRALVWRTTGGKHRYLLGDCDRLVEDDVAQFRAATVRALGAARAMTLDTLEAEHAMLSVRQRTADGVADPAELWRRLGVPADTDVGRLPVHAVRALRPAAEEVAP